MSCKNCFLVVVLLTMVFSTAVPDAAIGQGFWNKAKPLLEPPSVSVTSLDAPGSAMGGGFATANGSGEGLLQRVVSGPVDTLQTLSEAAFNSLLGREEIALAVPQDITTSPPVALGHSGSLFIGKDYFAAPSPASDATLAVRESPDIAAPDPKRFAPHGVARLRDVIAKAEAGAANYDAVQLAAKIKPPKRPTELTISEIYAWIEATPGQHHAIGRYQFIPKTLRRLVNHVGVSPDAVFSPQVQDQLADQLLKEAGLIEFRAGDITRAQFMHNLSKIWAGLPSASGKSYYHGYAGNKATMSWKTFDRLVRAAFADGEAARPVVLKTSTRPASGIAVKRKPLPTRANF